MSDESIDGTGMVMKFLRMRSVLKRTQGSDCDRDLYASSDCSPAPRTLKNVDR